MPFWVVSAASALLIAGLSAVLFLRRPPAPLWPIAVACWLFAFIWVLGDLWATHASTLAEKHVALSVLFTGSTLLPVAWWETARRYVAWYGLAPRWLESPVIGWVALGYACVAWVFAVSNPWHGQFMEPLIGARNQYEWGIVPIVYANWGFTLATTALCGWAAWCHSSMQVRRKLALLSVATLAPLVTNLVHIFLPGGPREDTTAIGLGIATAAIIYGISRERLFNLLPVGLHEILRTDRDGMFFLDRGGRLLLWNPAGEKLLESVLIEPEMPLLEVLATRLEDCDGKRLSTTNDLLDALTAERDARPLFRYVGGGGECWLRFSLVSLASGRGRLAAVFLRVEDATRATREERAARERFRSGEQPVDRGSRLALMAGGVAHDFNNLLTVIDGRAQIALEDAARGLPVRRHLMKILKAAELAREFTAELLTYAGRATVSMRPVDVSELVDDTIGLLWDLVPSHVELQSELVRPIPSVDGDAPQLRQVMMNLVKNGAEAIGDGAGVVAIHTSVIELDGPRMLRYGLGHPLEYGEYVVLEVTDSGSGMGEEAQQRAFDAFFTTKTSGRGLGLAVVAAIVESHGGLVSIDSRPNWGTTVRVWLPVSGLGVAAESPASRADA